VRAGLMLRDALFQQGRDISCPDELAAVAEAITLPGPMSTADQVLADWHEGQRRGHRLTHASSATPTTSARPCAPSASTDTCALPAISTASTSSSDDAAAAEVTLAGLDAWRGRCQVTMI
jgi:hypothetical protein